MYACMHACMYVCIAKLIVFLMENPIKMDDLGGSPIVGNHHILNSQQIQKRSGKMEESWYVQHLIDLPVVGKSGPFSSENPRNEGLVCIGPTHFGE